MACERWCARDRHPARPCRVAGVKDPVKTIAEMIRDMHTRGDEKEKEDIFRGVKVSILHSGFENLFQFKNKFDQYPNLVDHLHKDCTLDTQKNYVFCKVQDVLKSIRGLWFHDYSDCRKYSILI